jgi:hypothetical protein
MDHAADALASCGCRADVATIEAFAWTRYGRHWGRPTVSHPLRIVSRAQVAAPDPEDEPMEALAAAAGASWQEVAPRVIAAAKDGKRVAFAVL